MDKKYLFIDCFNTVILRRVSANEVVYLWAEKLGNKYDIEPIIIYKEFNNIKKKMAVSRFCRSFESEMYLEEILIKLTKCLVAKCRYLDIKAFFKDAIIYYVDTEMENQYLNETFTECLRKFKAEGKKIYIVSDFYCSKIFIYAMLKNLGVDEIFDDIFTSCDFRKSKATGRLYGVIIKKLGIRKRDVMMFGDNFWADVIMSHLRGVKAIHLRTNKVRGNRHKTRVADSLAEKLTEVSECPNFKYNFSDHAFPLYLFTKRLYSALTSEGVRNVFFLSREGQFLKKLFDIYCRVLDEKYGIETNIKTHYLYASRNSILSAGLNDLTKENFYYLFRASSAMSIRKFLLTLAFTDDEIEDIKCSMGIDIDKKVMRFNKSKYFLKLKSDATFFALYEKKRIERRTALSMYMDSFGVNFQKDGFTIVDIGWNGTMQNLFNKFFNGTVKIKGYYVGNKRADTSDSEQIGLLYDKNNSHLFGNDINRHTIYNYEQICRADHNRCDSYKIICGKAQVILDERLNDVEIYKNLTKPLQDEILDKFKKIALLDYANLSNIDVYATIKYYNLVKNKTEADWLWLFASQDSHQDNFGDVRYPFKVVTQNVRRFAFKLLDLLFIVTKAFKVHYLKKEKID